MGPSLRHDRGSRGGEEEEQTSGSESEAGGEATSVSEFGASPWQPVRRGGRANQWVRVLGITVAVEEERRKSKPVGPSPWHHRGSRGGEEEEQTSGSESGAGGGATSGSESRASLWQPGRTGGGTNQWVQVWGRRRSNQCVQVRGITVVAGEKRRRSKPVGLSPRQEEEQPVGPSPGHHRGSRG